MQDGLGPKRCFQILKIQILEYKLGSFVSTSLHCDPKTLHTYTMAGFELMIFCTGCGSKEGLQSRKEIFQISPTPLRTRYIHTYAQGPLSYVESNVSVYLRNPLTAKTFS
jgi:hypothetical protein